VRIAEAILVVDVGQVAAVASGAGSEGKLFQPAPEIPVFRIVPDLDQSALA
jgi:hypothetical protein